MKTYTVKPSHVSLSYLFSTFFKIGLVSFGGNIALIAMVQKILIDRDKKLNDGFVLNATGIASLLPGPLAVNVVTYCGYYLKGRLGAAVSMLAVLLPALILMMVISWLYFFSDIKMQFANLMEYVIGAVAAIILSTGVSLFRKEVLKNPIKITICVLTAIVMFFAKSYAITVLVLLLGAITGIIFKFNPNESKMTEKVDFSFSDLKKNAWIFVTLAAAQIGFLTKIFTLFKNIYLQIIFVFSGISLSLFGGGYVMVPIMQMLFVGELKWVNSKEFVDAVAFSQATPGPILISATFIGFKLGGFFGSILATAAIFVPSAILMIIVSSFIQTNHKNTLLINVMQGIKCVVVGMIIISAIIIVRDGVRNYAALISFVLAFLLNYFYKISTVYLVLSVCLIGVISKLFFSA